MTLRPMQMTDADFMLELKNDPQTREFAIITHDKIKREDHLKWLERNLHSMTIVEGKKKSKVAAIRITKSEISLWVSKNYRNKGVATAILKELPIEPEIIAKIVDGNISSFRAFINAGFKPIIHKDNYYILKR